MKFQNQKFNNSKVEASLQEKLSGRVLIDEPLKKYTTMRVGGPAKFFYKALTSQQICQAVESALKLEIPYFLLGRGGNVVFSDKGFEGLVILNQAERLSFLPEKAQVLVESGMVNSRLVMKSASHGLGGIEFLATIPGTLGGAVYGNAGAYGWEIGSFVVSVSLLLADVKRHKIKIVKKNRNFLSPLYRSTRLKRTQTKLIKSAGGISQTSHQAIVLSVILQLQRKDTAQITRQIKKYLALRKRRQPQGVICSGSVFKNPLGRSSKEKEVYRDIKKTAAYMLDQIGAKKIKAGDARVAQRHANFLIHSGKATAQDIKDLLVILQNKVYEQFGIHLEPEIEFVGKFR